MALAAAPFAAQAETWNIYGWQNHSWEFVDIDGGRSFDRIQSNAGNIGFAASVDTGMNGIHINVQCEQFMYVNHFAGGTGWCNRNSKIGLSHPQMGEIMFATWLLPYNEGVAQWVDPFYDAGADSHTSIMGSVGANTIFYNTGDFDIQASNSGPGTGFGGDEFNYAGAGYDTGFNRRQENIIQYWSPNWNGFVFRFAWTAGIRDEGGVSYGADNKLDTDPVIRSSSLAYTNGPLWLAVTWQDHEDWTAVAVGEMDSSDAESFRVAGRYIMDMGDGMSVQLSAMWEDLEYEFNGVSSVDAAMGAFGYGNFDTYNLMYAGADDANIKAEKTIDLVREVFAGCYGDDGMAKNPGFTQTDPEDDSTRTGPGDSIKNCPDAFSLHVDVDSDSDLSNDTNNSLLPNYMAPGEDDPSTDESEDAELGNGGTSVADAGGDNAEADALKDAIMALKMAAEAEGDAEDKDAQAAYKALTDKAKANARTNFGAGGNVSIERDAWMVSGKIKFGGPVDFRFSYMDADDLEVSCGGCSGDWSETAADAWNFGVFYTMPAGTELRLTYSEVNNDDNGTYGQGISGTGLSQAGTEIEMFAVGVVHWFD